MFDLDIRPYVRSRRGAGGRTFSYVPWADLAYLLNAKGLAWHWAAYVEAGGACVRGRLTIHVAGRPTCREALATVIGDAENRYEVAEASAFRRALAKFGVGLDLWRDSDA